LLGNIECSNEKCKYYSENLYPKSPPQVTTEKVEKSENSSSSEGVPEGYEMTYHWSNYHHDFGD